MLRIAPLECLDTTASGLSSLAPAADHISRTHEAGGKNLLHGLNSFGQRRGALGLDSNPVATAPGSDMTNALLYAKPQHGDGQAPRLY
jgi:hypothetical protein